MNQDPKELLMRLLQNSQSGIENKRTIERVCGEVKHENGDLIQIDKECYLDETGGVREVNITNIRVYACGCKVEGRANFGGMDYKGNLVCVRHFFRCIRCRRPLSILTVKAINGICYCSRCVRIVKIKRFFGLRK